MIGLRIALFLFLGFWRLPRASAFFFLPDKEFVLLEEKVILRKLLKVLLLPLELKVQGCLQFLAFSPHF